MIKRADVLNIDVSPLVDKRPKNYTMRMFRYQCTKCGGNEIYTSTETGVDGYKVILCLGCDAEEIIYAY